MNRLFLTAVDLFALEKKNVLVKAGREERLKRGLFELNFELNYHDCISRFDANRFNLNRGGCRIFSRGGGLFFQKKIRNFVDLIFLGRPNWFSELS